MGKGCQLWAMEQGCYWAAQDEEGYTKRRKVWGSLDMGGQEGAATLKRREYASVATREIGEEKTKGYPSGHTRVHLVFCACR